VGAASATLNQGSGIFPYLDGSNLKFGILAGDQNPASQILDYSSEPNGTYAVYVRSRYNPATIQNRVFWNPGGSPAREYVDNVATRDIATWEVLSQDSAASPPGSGEWVKIYEITVVANLITAVTEFRHFFYEGSANPTDAYAHEWGDGANDRDDDRTLSPVTDAHRHAQMLRRQVSDIIGLGGAHKAVTESTLQGLFPAVSSATPTWNRITQWKNTRDQELYRYTPYGRLASVRRFKDDFWYHATNWGSGPGSYGPLYVGSVVGGSSIAKGVSAAGLLALGAPNDSALLETDDHFLFRSGGPTNESMLSLYARISLSDNTDVIAQIGFTDSAGNWRIRWVLNTGVSSSWILVADDGVNPPVSVAALASVAATDTHFGIQIDPFAGAGVGSIAGSIDVGGTLVNGSAVMPGVGATFLGTLALRASVETLDGGAKLLDLDYWEVWDERLHAGVLV
jgi:hypothetical protein